MAFNPQIQNRSADFLYHGLTGAGDAIGAGLGKMYDNNKEDAQLGKMAEMFGYNKDEVANMSLGEKRGLIQADMVKFMRRGAELQDQERVAMEEGMKAFLNHGSQPKFSKSWNDDPYTYGARTAAGMPNGALAGMKLLEMGNARSDATNKQALAASKFYMDNQIAQSTIGLNNAKTQDLKNNANAIPQIFDLGDGNKVVRIGNATKIISAKNVGEFEKTIGLMKAATESGDSEVAGLYKARLDKLTNADPISSFIMDRLGANRGFGKGPMLTPEQRAQRNNQAADSLNF